MQSPYLYLLLSTQLLASDTIIRIPSNGNTIYKITPDTMHKVWPENGDTLHKVYPHTMHKVDPTAERLGRVIASCNERVSLFRSRLTQYIYDYSMSGIPCAGSRTMQCTRELERDLNDLRRLWEYNRPNRQALCSPTRRLLRNALQIDSYLSNAPSSRLQGSFGNVQEDRVYKSPAEF